MDIITRLFISYKSEAHSISYVIYQLCHYFLPALTVIVFNVIFAIATLRAAGNIHKGLLENTLKLPTVFFDVTPIGRILARFSSDINGVDSMLPMTFQMVLNNALRVSRFVHLQ